MDSLYCTVDCTVVEWVSVPLVAVMVSVLVVGGGGTSPNPPPRPDSAVRPVSDNRPKQHHEQTSKCRILRDGRSGSRTSRARAGTANGQSPLIESVAVF